MSTRLAEEEEEDDPAPAAVEPSPPLVDPAPPGAETWAEKAAELLGRLREPLQFSAELEAEVRAKACRAPNSVLQFGAATLLETIVTSAAEERQLGAVYQVPGHTVSVAGGEGRTRPDPSVGWKTAWLHGAEGYGPQDGAVEAEQLQGTEQLQGLVFRQESGHIVISRPEQLGMKGLEQQQHSSGLLHRQELHSFYISGDLRDGQLQPGRSIGMTDGDREETTVVNLRTDQEQFALS